MQAARLRRIRCASLAASRGMTSPLIFDLPASPFDGNSFVPVLPLPGLVESGRDVEQQSGASAPQQSIFALHLVNGEHYSGAERVQDLLAKQLPRLGCEVGF